MSAELMSALCYAMSNVVIGTLTDLGGIKGRLYQNVGIILSAIGVLLVRGIQDFIRRDPERTFWSFWKDNMTMETSEFEQTAAVSLLE